MPKRKPKVPPILKLVRLRCGCICTAPNKNGACYKIYRHDKEDKLWFEFHTINKRAEVTELEQFEVDRIIDEILRLMNAGYQAFEMKKKLKQFLDIDKIQRNLRGLP